MGSLASLSRFVRHLSRRGRRVSLPPSLRAIAGTSRTCIGYAFRPRLSSRLTLGGLALPRKPWVYGGGVFHAALVTHASILTSGRSTAGCPDGFAADGKLPYH